MLMQLLSDSLGYYRYFKSVFLGCIQNLKIEPKSAKYQHFWDQFDGM
jgi:hypothetical protein